MTSKTNDRMVRNYYTVYLPDEVCSDPNTRRNLAIGAARNRTRKYVIPCSWSVVWDDGQDVRVKREYRKSWADSANTRLELDRTSGTAQ